MTPERFEYEGEVRLLCQEGGYADHSISLMDNPGEPLDITHKFLAAMGEPMGESLAHQLARFALAEGDRFGDVALGRLRITVERVDA